MVRSPTEKKMFYKLASVFAAPNVELSIGRSNVGNES